MQLEEREFYETAARYLKFIGIYTGKAGGGSE